MGASAIATRSPAVLAAPKESAPACHPVQNLAMLVPIGGCMLATLAGASVIAVAASFGGSLAASIALLWTYRVRKVAARRAAAEIEGQPHRPDAASASPKILRVARRP